MPELTKEDKDRLAYQARVKDEHEEVKGRVSRLESFINGPEYYNVHDEEKGMLQAQLQHMKQYMIALSQRVRFHSSQS